MENKYCRLLRPCFVLKDASERRVPFQGEVPVVLTTDGRPKRRTRRPVDYKETDGDTPYDLEKYLERVQKEAELRSESPLLW